MNILILHCDKKQKQKTKNESCHFWLAENEYVRIFFYRFRIKAYKMTKYVEIDRGCLSVRVCVCVSVCVCPGSTA